MEWKSVQRKNQTKISLRSLHKQKIFAIQNLCKYCRNQVWFFDFIQIFAQFKYTKLGNVTVMQRGYNMAIYVN